MISRIRPVAISAILSYIVMTIRTSSFWLCLQQVSVIPKHVFSTVLIQNLHVAWNGLVAGTKVLSLLVSYSLHPHFSQGSKLDQLQIQTSDSDHQNHWSLHQWWVPDQFLEYWSQSQSFHSLFWTVKNKQKIQVMSSLLIIKIYGIFFVIYVIWAETVRERRAQTTM